MFLLGFSGFCLVFVLGASLGCIIILVQSYVKTTKTHPYLMGTFWRVLGAIWNPKSSKSQGFIAFFGPQADSFAGGLQDGWNTEIFKIVGFCSVFAPPLQETLDNAPGGAEARNGSKRGFSAIRRSFSRLEPKMIQNVGFRTSWGHFPGWRQK